MSRWYGLGGDWINTGLPHYVAIERKPENGCEIQDMCCGKSGIMMGLRVVKQEELEGKSTFNHGLKVMLKLLQGWNSRGRVVCADSYFASVQAAIELWKEGWRFIGVVKTSHKNYPKEFLGSIQLKQRGECAGLKAKVYDDGFEFDLLACVYCDRDRHYFISTCSNLSAGEPIERIRWRQVAEVEDDEPPERLKFDVNVPECAELYYSTCGAIDCHNRCRQDALDIEKKLETKSWSNRVNMSIFGMIVVDSWLLYNGCVGGGRLTQKEFYKALLMDLIDNAYGVGVRSRRSTSSSAEEAASVSTAGTSGRGLHLTPTKRKLEQSSGGKTTFLQARCRVCGKKTILRCSVCRGQPEIGDGRAGFCCPTSGRPCFEHHMVEKHE